MLLDFGQQQQQVLEYLHFEDGSPVKDFPLGHGQLFWVAYPVELSDSSRPAGTLYQQAVERAGIPPLIEGGFLFGDELLVQSIQLQNAVLYILENESANDALTNLRDPATATELKFRLPSQHAALALIDKHTKQVVAKYGF